MVSAMWQEWTTIEAMPQTTPHNSSQITSTVAGGEAGAGDQADVQTLEGFLADIERRAFRMAQVSTGDREAALDIVQESMMKLVQSYRDRPADQWRPLYFRILNNCITDWHRRQSTRWQVFDRWFGGRALEGRDEESADDMDQFEHSAGDQPERQLLAQLALEDIERAVHTLSKRQQQAFMLRCWEGLSTADTAAAMDCTEGTVKTLYSRAMSSLRQVLGEHYER